MCPTDNLPMAEGEPENIKKTEPTANETEEVVSDGAAPTSEKDSDSQHVTENQSDQHMHEVESENATDAEDHDNHRRHFLPMEDYHNMSLEKLVDVLEKLLKNERVQVIRDHVESIKSEFNSQYEALIEEKKEAFIEEGGNELDFDYSLPIRQHFQNLYKEYKEKRNHYYKELEQALQTNLQTRLEIIEEVKSLLNLEENIQTTYKHFRELQERWKQAGPVPRANYNDVWRTYHHHVEIFYDFMDLNKDLRDLDFKHNLEEKLKILERAEALKSENDVPKMFRELQLIHKIWKEDLGPVAKEHREEIWDKFSAITKELHQKRQDFIKNQDAIYQANLEVKNELISSLEALSEPTDKHSEWQRRIVEVEKLRASFFKAGRVPQASNEITWKRFKKALRNFNHNKNEFYKNLKKDQQDNLNKKMALLEKARSFKDSEDWDTVTPIMKQIQAEWKEIGHVPRKFSDKIWHDFKEACNHYFNRLHANKNKGSQKDQEVIGQKKQLIEALSQIDFEKLKDKTAVVEELKEILDKWHNLPRTDVDQRSVNGKFYRNFENASKKAGLSKEEVDMLRFNNRIEHLSEKDDDALYRERVYLRKRIEEIKDEIRQLENNIQFFNVSDPNNPLFRDVQKNIENLKHEFEILKEKLKAVREINQ
ncbi:MAG: DUF349 domain-containing protein [Flavobacteriaceae bacterium]|nr:DUF349 domain-containing protein [Flavobacteriaceae bacterium]